ncbi:hypothetical protein LCGC14_2748580 [marine sediment metagenome]|uniref:YopX protein domain-containing protein n=1 Tax=marine sediment metagenome TaxID=412755 RepID=A0A0F8Z2E7_9ZZZZ
MGSQREIKFRQAIAATAEVPFYWHYWGCLKSDSTGIPMFTGPIAIMSRDKRQSYQFTGLLDKQGKEIYEGDMVRICNLECQLQIFEATGQVVERYAAWGVTNLKIIKFEKYSLKINPPNAIDIMYFLNILGCKHIEVIGNQFQSPKLLETKQ